MNEQSIPLREGHIKKGGVNSAPTTPKPRIRPPAQRKTNKSLSTLEAALTKLQAEIDADHRGYHSEFLRAIYNPEYDFHNGFFCIILPHDDSFLRFMITTCLTFQVRSICVDLIPDLDHRIDKDGTIDITDHPLGAYIKDDIPALDAVFLQCLQESNAYMPFQGKLIPALKTIIRLSVV